MWILLAAVPLLIAVRVALAPVSARRSARFVALHRLDPTPPDRDLIAAYLAHTRRWRVLGVCCGYAAALVRTLPEQRIVVPVAAVVAGWFAPAVVAEFRRRAPGGPLPGWLCRVPVVLAVVAVACTTLTLIAGRATSGASTVPAWGAGALGCAALLSVTNRRIARRPAADGSAVARATATHSAGAIAAAGTFLSATCLGAQVAAVRDGFFEATGRAVAVIAILVVLAGAAVGWCLGRAGVRDAAVPVIAVVLIVSALGLGSAGVLGRAWWHDRPPHPASVLGAGATIRLTDPAHFDRDARAIGVTGLSALIQDDARLFVGRLDYRLPERPDRDGTYHVVVIDSRDNRVVPQLFTADGGGWNGFLSALPRRYPWLSALASERTGGGYSAPGMEVSVGAGSPGPVTFVGSVPDGPGLKPADLSVVLIYSGPDNQTYWAHRVTDLR